MEAELRKFYQLKTDLFTVTQQLDTAAARLSQAKYDQRQAKSAVLEYEGSFRCMIDRFSGKQESRKEELARNLRNAEAQLSAVTRELETLKLQKETTETALEALPGREEFLSSGQTALLHRLDAKLCLKMLSGELEENYAALLAMRDQLQGRNSNKIMSVAEIQEIYSRPDTSGEICRKLLEQLEADLTALGIPFPVPDYYRSPGAYIHAVASDALRRDRVNLALEQVLAMQKQAEKLILEIQ